LAWKSISGVVSCLLARLVRAKRDDVSDPQSHTGQPRERFLRHRSKLKPVSSVTSQALVNGQKTVASNAAHATMSRHIEDSATTSKPRGYLVRPQRGFDLRESPFLAAGKSGVTRR
jgi:hypothetical protein